MPLKQSHSPLTVLPQGQRSPRQSAVRTTTKAGWKPMKRNHFSSMMLTVCLCWMPAQFVFAQNAIGQISLYDNMELPRAGLIGPRLESKQRDLAQQFVMGDSDNVSSIPLFLQRHGSPLGEVGVEIWEDGGSGVPSSLVTSVGTIDLLDDLSSPPQRCRVRRDRSKFLAHPFNI